MGDTNCDLVDNKNANTKRLKRVYSEFQLEQLIKTYTRVAINTSDARYIIKTGTRETGIVDHYLIYGIRKINAWQIK